MYPFTASVGDSDNSDVISPFLPVVYGERDCLSFIWGFYVAFNTVQVISRRVVGRAEETSTYSLLGFCTVNCRPMASNYQLSHLRLCWGSNLGLRGGRRECYHSTTMAPWIVYQSGDKMLCISHNRACWVVCLCTFITTPCILSNIFKYISLPISFDDYISLFTCLVLLVSVFRWKLSAIEILLLEYSNTDFSPFNYTQHIDSHDDFSNI